MKRLLVVVVGSIFASFLSLIPVLGLSQPAFATGDCGNSSGHTIYVQLTGGAASVTDATVKINRSDTSNPSVYPSSYNLSYSSGKYKVDNVRLDVQRTDKGNFINYFSVAVSGSATGSKSQTYIDCGKDPTLQVPATTASQGSKLGTMTGILTFVDNSDNGKTKPFQPNSTISITDSHKKKISGSVLAGGKFTFSNLTPDTYQLDASDVYVNPNNSLDTVNPQIHKTGIVISSGKITDLKTLSTTVGVGNFTTPAPSPAANQSAQNDDNNDPCVTATGAYSWMFCPAFKLANKALVGENGDGGIYGALIEPVLQIDPLTKNSPVKPVWSAFVKIADVLFVLAFLILIFGQTLNLDAYTIKKSLPRLVIAAIAVQISYFLCGIIIDIGNILGSGIQEFVRSAVAIDKASTDSLGKGMVSAGTTAIIAGLAGTAAVAALGFSLVVLLVGLVISILAFFITLTLRVLILNVLILLSPIALVAWVLPNTEQYFKLWRNNFIKLVMVYPIIALILSAGYIIQKAAAGTSQVDQIIAGMAPILAFFLMPRAFKMSGSLMSSASGVVKSRGGSLGKSAKKATQSGLDNSAILKARSERKLRENLTTMNDPGSNKIKRAIAQRCAGFGYAPTAGAMAGGYSKLEGIEKANESGATRQLSDVPPDKLKDVLAAKSGSKIEVEMADGSKRLIGISEDHKTAAIRMMANKAQWKDLREAKAAGAANGGVSAAELSKGLAGTDAFSKARDLTMEPDKAFSDVTADMLGNMHSSTVTQYLNHVERLKSGPDQAAYNTAKLQLETASAGVLSNNNLRSKLTSDSAEALSNAANKYPSSNSSVADGPLISNTEVIKLVNENIDPNTKILNPRMPVPPSTQTP